MEFFECKVGQEVLYHPFSNTKICIITDTQGLGVTFGKIQIEEKGVPNNNGWVLVSDLKLIHSVDIFISTNNRHKIRKVNHAIL